MRKSSGATSDCLKSVLVYEGHQSESRIFVFELIAIMCSCLQIKYISIGANNLQLVDEIKKISNTLFF